MADERWQVLSDWLSEWLEADPRARVRLRDELAANHPELVGEADRMSSSAESLTGFLDTPALVLAARELVVDAPVLPAGSDGGPLSCGPAPGARRHGRCLPRHRFPAGP